MTVQYSDFVDALLDPHLPVPSGLTIRGKKIEKRFSVYRNNVAVSLKEALQELFPVIRKLVGDEFFTAMAGVYLRKHPPESPFLPRFGNRMPEFLANFEPVGHLPYLPDIARLEILIRECFHSKDSSPLSGEYLASLQPAKLLESGLFLAPSVRILQSRFPIYGIWLANVSGGCRPANRPEDVLIARKNFEPNPYLLPRGGHEFIDSLLQGACISEAADLASSKQSSFELDRALAILLKSGAVAGIGPSLNLTDEKKIKCE